MSKEIKFRAWDKRRKRMRGVMDIKYFENGDIRINATEKERNYEPLVNMQKYNGKELIEFELMQYTGLKDKNGKEIYEGDIVRGNDSYDDGREIFGVVDFQDCSFVIKNDCATHYRWMDYTIEVIGNIYEDGGLL